MSEPVYDYYATRIVQDLEDDLYESKERIQRLRRWNDQLTAENERLRDGVKQVVETMRVDANGMNTRFMGNTAAYLRQYAGQLGLILNGDTE